ncbi:CPCC family cysteine-rich protein [Nocardiopsis sp. CC223A]|uniref:CPCC family cysteine-rich protein n=1 Tax=Nocardiopsis sp. CC223A TaxID=3044051 RepID=UPI003557945F
MKFTCPCCGRKTFEGGPGSGFICPVCYWGDEIVQLRWPLLDGCANKVSLVCAQGNFISFGASDVRFLEVVSRGGASWDLDDSWRPIDFSVDNFENTLEESSEWPRDMTVLYWWTDFYWRL